MALKFYNTLTRKKEVFKSIHNKTVHMYSCGPTVYAPPHIGNFRSFIVSDIITRYLIYKGFKVKKVMNITDIDDKTIRDSAKEGMSLKGFTKKYEKIFFQDLERLNIRDAWKYPRATEHVEDMIEFTKKLVEKGYAYVKKGSVYYDISKFKDYGKLSKVDLSQTKTRARVDVDEYDKESPRDFALMKKSTEGEIERNICYDTEWGKVRPGWHIECSVMSTKYLGDTFDIHTGGIDLIFPHHENEIAQSEAATGKKFVNYWLHNEFLLVEGEKMSKSLGNFYTLEDLIEKGHDPLAIRYLLMGAHYRQQMNFTFKGLEDAAKTIESLYEFMKKLGEVSGKGTSDEKVESLVKDVEKKFEEHMDNDLNISPALASIFNFVTEVNKLLADEKIGEEGAKLVRETMIDFDKVLGLKLNQISKKELPEGAEKLIKKREEARNKKDFEKADDIRKKLEKEFSIIIEDTESGTRWKFKKK